MNAVLNASWRVKAALGCLVFAKVNGLAAGFTIMGMLANGQLRGLAQTLMLSAALGVAGALVFAAMEYGQHA